jgi:hypothetical protein
MNLRTRTRQRGIFILSVALLLCPLAARADAGIPMLPIAYPVVLWFLVPVILIEAVYLRARLGTKWWRTLKGVSVVNLFTLLLGYPLAWLISFLLELLFIFLAVLLSKIGFAHALYHIPAWVEIILFPAWLGSSEQLWPVLVAFDALLIPAFFVSAIAESWMMERGDLLRYEGECKRAIWQANALSYLFLAVVGCVTLYFRFGRIHLPRP